MKFKPQNLLMLNKKKLFIIIVSFFIVFKIYGTVAKFLFVKKEIILKPKVSVIKVINKENYGNIIGYGNFTNGTKVNVFAEVSSDVEKIIVNGHTKVKKGDLIMILKDRMINSGYKNAKYAHKNAEANYLASQQMFSKNLISQSDLNVAEANYQMAVSNLQRTSYGKNNLKIKALFDGTLTDVMVNEGQFVLGKESMAGQTILYTIIKDENLSLDVPISGKYINDIKKGEEVAIICDYGNFNGKITRYENSINLNTGYFTVVIAPQDKKDIISGSSCSVKIPYKINESWLIDSDILTVNQEILGVKIIKDNKVEFRAINIIHDEGNKMIVKGIENDDLLIVVGGDNLKIQDSIDIQDIIFIEDGANSKNIIKND